MRLIIIMMALLLAGCSTPVPVVTAEKPQIVFPPAPEPVSIPEVHWSVIKEQNKTYYALSYEDLEKLMLALNDVRVWIQKKNAENTFYQKSLMDEK